MTAHDTNLPDRSTHPATPPERSNTGANRDTAAVIVWRITADAADEPDTAAAPAANDSPLTSRLARHLVAIYTDVHGTVVDFDADINLRRAAETTGRRYVAVTGPAGPTAAADRLPAAVLIMLRWPRTATTALGHDANSLLIACQQHLADDGCTIVIVTAGTAGTSYGEHEQVLLAAAQAAGLRHLHDIVPLDAADGRDAFTYATAHNTTAPDLDSDSDTPRQTARTTLVIFGHPGRP
jgi:hypothetical protein